MIRRGFSRKSWSLKNAGKPQWRCKHCNTVNRRSICWKCGKPRAGQADICVRKIKKAQEEPIESSEK